MVMDPDLMDQYHAEEDGGEDLSRGSPPGKRLRLGNNNEDDDINEDDELSREGPDNRGARDAMHRHDGVTEEENSVEPKDKELRRGLTQPEPFPQQLRADSEEGEQPMTSEETEAERALRAVQERLEREQAEDLSMDSELPPSAAHSKDRLQNGFKHGRMHLEKSPNSVTASAAVVVNSRKDYPDGEGNTLFSTMSSQFSPLNSSPENDLREGRSGDERGNSDHFLGCEGVSDKLASKKSLTDDISCNPLNFSTASFLGAEASSRQLHQNGIDSKGSHDEGEDGNEEGEIVSAPSKGLLKDRISGSPMSRPFVVQLPDTEPAFPRSQHQSPPLDS